MFRRIAFLIVAISLIAGVGAAWAQTAPDSTAPPSAPADTSKAAPPSAPADTSKPAPPPPPPSQAVPPLVFYEKAKVVVDGEAQANGTLEMIFTPQNGAAKILTVNVLAKASKKDVARDIHKELSIAAGAAYKVKLDNDKVKLSKVKKESPNFAVTITKVALPGVSVLVGKD